MTPSPQPKPKRRRWREIVGVVIILLKLVQFSTTGIPELERGVTASYRVGAITGDVFMFGIAVWLILSARPRKTGSFVK